MDADQAYGNQIDAVSTQRTRLHQGGIRVFDIRNPFQPQEVAHFVPPLTEGAPSVGINDVHVDEKGIIYVTDHIKGGLYILEMTN